MDFFFAVGVDEDGYFVAHFPAEEDGEYADLAAVGSAAPTLFARCGGTCHVYRTDADLQTAHLEIVSEELETESPLPPSPVLTLQPRHKRGLKKTLRAFGW